MPRNVTHITILFYRLQIILLDTYCLLLNLEYNDNMPKINKLSPNGIPLNYDQINEPKEDLKEQFLGKIGLLSEEEQKNFFHEVLTPNGYNLIVTSKDIDLEVEDLSKIVAWGINKALHQNILSI